MGYEKNEEFILIKDGSEKKVSESEYFKELKETPANNFSLNQKENTWEVKNETPYEDAPHTMEFKWNAESRKVT